MKKRFLSLLLTVCMLLTLLPAAALAAETTRSTPLDLTAPSISYAKEGGGSATVSSATYINDCDEGWAWYTGTEEYSALTGNSSTGFASGGVLELDGLILEHNVSVPANTTIMLTDK